MRYRSWEVDQADAGNQLILSCKSGQTLIFVFSDSHVMILSDLEIELIFGKFFFFQAEIR
jgi:hypothetical protein